MDKQTTTTADFKIHPAILNSVIKAQAGTPEKAFLELVMNSIDARATQVCIEFDGCKFSVTDDGKGFSGKKEVEDFFGTFGTPHKEGDATYGKFRMGRGQIFAFAHNSWRTDEFEMAVDIEGQGLCYSLKEGLPVVKGCAISGNFYQPLDAYQVDRFAKTLSKMVKYSQIPVMLNRERISIDPSLEKWDVETDDAYIKKREGHLSIYNLGVFVCDVWRTEYATGGVVVSKKPLEVNFARNDILRSKCQTWKRISTHLQNESTKTVIKKTRLDSAEKTNLSTRLLSGDIQYSTVKKAKILTDVADRDISIERLLREPRIAFAKGRKDRLADRVHQQGRACVLSEETLERFGIESLTSLRSGLIRAIGREIESKKKASKGPYCDTYTLENDIRLLENIVLFEDLTEFRNLYDVNYTVFHDDCHLSGKNKCALKVLNDAEPAIRDLIDHVMGSKRPNSYTSSIPKRQIYAGKSDIADAWTDGISMIVIDRPLLNNADKGVPGFLYLCSILLHEYLHSESDSGSHIHDGAFHQAFHNCLLHRNKYSDSRDVYTTADRMASRYYTQIKKAGLSVSKKLFDCSPP